MSINYDAIAGTACAGCGIGDAIEILELDGEGTYYQGKVWHVECRPWPIREPRKVSGGPLGFRDSE